MSNIRRPAPSLKDLPAFACETVIKTMSATGEEKEAQMCGCLYFTKVMQLRSISALASQNGQAQLAEVPFYQCVGCGAVYTPDQVHQPAESQVN